MELIKHRVSHKTSKHSACVNLKVRKKAAGSQSF